MRYSRKTYGHPCTPRSAPHGGRRCPPPGRLSLWRAPSQIHIRPKGTTEGRDGSGECKEEQGRLHFCLSESLQKVAGFLYHCFTESAHHKRMIDIRKGTPANPYGRSRKSGMTQYCVFRPSWFKMYCSITQPTEMRYLTASGC